VQLLFFEPLERDKITAWIMLNYQVDSVRAQKIAELSEGSLETAKGLVDVNEKERDGFSLWQKLKTSNLHISDVLELSKNTARSGALECVDAMIAEAKKDFRMYPQETETALDMLNISRYLLLKNVNAQTVLDNLFFDLYDL
jgi:DNA polymerase-3 subunit delta'